MNGWDTKSRNKLILMVSKQTYEVAPFYPLAEWTNRLTVNLKYIATW